MFTSLQNFAKWTKHTPSRVIFFPQSAVLRLQIAECQNPMALFISCFLHEYAEGRTVEGKSWRWQVLFLLHRGVGTELLTDCTKRDVRVTFLVQSLSPFLLGKIRFVPPQLREIGCHVQNHATQWHDFNMRSNFEKLEWHGSKWPLFIYLPLICIYTSTHVHSLVSLS